MHFKSNLNINRFLWAKQTVENIVLESGNQNLILFDVGAGAEIMRKEYLSPNLEYISYDLEPKLPTTFQWNIEYPFPYGDKQANIITLLEVIEHLDNPWISIKNISDTLRPGGYLLITTPNPLWSNARMDLLLNGKLTCFTQTDLNQNHHVFTPMPHIVEKLLFDNGFKIITYHTLDGKTQLFGKSLSFRRFPAQLIYRGIKKIIEHRDPIACGMSYAILAQKS
jgi:SAM-dependent methyltransferase